MTLTGAEVESWRYLAVCVPIVVFFAPFGSYVSSHFHRQVLAILIYILDTIALVGFTVNWNWPKFWEISSYELNDTIVRNPIWQFSSIETNCAWAGIRTSNLLEGSKWCLSILGHGPKLLMIFCKDLHFILFQVTALVVLPMTLELWLMCTGLILGGFGFFWVISKLGERINTSKVTPMSSDHASDAIEIQP